MGDEKEEKEKAEASAEMKQADFAPPTKEDWGGDDGRVDDWSADGQPAAPVAGYQVTEDWSAPTETSDWAAASSEQAAPNWVVPTNGKTECHLPDSGGLESALILSVDV